MSCCTAVFSTSSVMCSGVSSASSSFGPTISRNFGRSTSDSHCRYALAVDNPPGVIAAVQHHMDGEKMSLLGHQEAAFSDVCAAVAVTAFALPLMKNVGDTIAFPRPLMQTVTVVDHCALAVVATKSLSGDTRHLL